MDLATYELLKWELADLIRAVPRRAGQASRNRSLFALLTEDRFNLAVIGRCSRGKSTLMNAMLATDRLPMGSESLTSVITSVTYGATERVTLHYETTTLFLEIGLDALEGYITKPGNPCNYRRIDPRGGDPDPGRVAASRLPLHRHPRARFRHRRQHRDHRAFPAGGGRLHPGRRLRRPAHRCRARHPAHGEGDRTSRLRRDEKADLVADQERQRMRDALHAACDRDILVTGEVYPISARMALSARLQRDPEQLSRSGLQHPEAAVISFLIREKHRDFLRRCASGSPRSWPRRRTSPTR